jgi:predicted nucleotidyltransferase
MRDYEVFLFGSALDSDNPSDIDILVIYAARIEPHQAVRFRAKLVRKLGKCTSVPIHVVLLSENEEREVKFVTCENCHLLTRRDLSRLRSLGLKRGG